MTLDINFEKVHWSCPELADALNTWVNRPDIAHWLCSQTLNWYLLQLWCINHERLLVPKGSTSSRQQTGQSHKKEAKFEHICLVGESPFVLWWIETQSCLELASSERMQDPWTINELLSRASASKTFKYLLSFVESHALARLHLFCNLVGVNYL